MTPTEGSYVGPSSCNEYTDRLGAGQRVLSYSYYTPGFLLYKRRDLQSPILMIHFLLSGFIVQEFPFRVNRWKDNWKSQKQTLV